MKINRELSNATTALLALLCEEPMHPWQIEKVVRHRDMRHWTELSQATIYSQLRCLRRAGLVECRPEVGRGRLRKVYAINGAGRAALRARLRVLLSQPEHLKWRVDLGIYNLDLLARREARGCLHAYRKKLVEGIACYRKLAAYMRSCGCSAARSAVARRPIYLLQGEVRWVNSFLKQFRSK